MSAKTEAIKAVAKSAGAALKKTATDAVKSEVAQAIRKEATEAAVGIATDLAVDAVSAATVKTVEAVSSKSSAAGKSLQRSFDKNLTARLAKVKQPIPTRVADESRLLDAGKEISQAEAMNNGMRVVEPVMKVGGMVAGHAANGAIQTANVVAPGAAAAAGFAADMAITTGVDILTEKMTATSTKRLQDAQAEVEKIDKVPPKEDIVCYFAGEMNRFVADSKMNPKKITDKDGRRLIEFLAKEGKRIGRGTVDKVLTMFYGFNSIPNDEKTKVVGAFGYLLSPIDLVPDSAPKIGFLDDVVVINFVYERIADCFSPALIAQAEGAVKALFASQSARAEIESTQETSETKPVVSNAEIPDQIGGIKTIKQF